VQGWEAALGIEGVLLSSLEPHADARGSLTEVFRASWLPSGGAMVQSNLSRSRPGVLRGLHFHREQSDLWVAVAGRAFVGLFDLREGSPTHGVKAQLVLDAEADPAALFIPPGVAHGFHATTELTLLYMVDRSYTGDDEFGLAWDDPDVAIGWPSRDPILSERDRTNPPLTEALQGAPRWSPAP
jgi:dTDP-4-dehydrorhamnose 3,5-epimerase